MDIPWQREERDHPWLRRLRTLERRRSAGRRCHQDQRRTDVGWKCNSSRVSLRRDVAFDGCVDLLQLQWIDSSIGDRRSSSPSPSGQGETTFDFDHPQDVDDEHSLDLSQGDAPLFLLLSLSRRFVEFVCSCEKRNVSSIDFVQIRSSEENCPRHESSSTHSFRPLPMRREIRFLERNADQDSLGASSSSTPVPLPNLRPLSRPFLPPLDTRDA